MMRRAALVVAVWLGAGPPAAAEDRYDAYAAVALEESWDSNVQSSRGDDAVTRVTPRVGLLSESERLQLGVDYRVGFHGYAYGSADPTINHRAGAFARWALHRRWNLDARALVIDADDPIVLERPAVAVPPGGIFEVQAASRLSHRITRRVTGEVGYAYRRSRFELADGPMPLAYDGDEHRADARAVWQSTRRLDTILAARGQYFKSSSDEAAAAPLAGVAWRATRKVRLSLEAGPVFYLPVDMAEGAVSYLGEARATWQGRRLRAALILLRDLYGGTGAPQAIWSEQATGVVAWRVVRAADLRFSGGLGRQGVAPNGDADASTLGGRAELRVALWHQLRFDVFAEQRTQDADGGLAFGDVDRTLVGARLVGVIGTSLETLSEVP